MKTLGKHELRVVEEYSAFKAVAREKDALQATELRKLRAALAQRPMDEKRLAYLDKFHWVAFKRGQIAADALKAILNGAAPVTTAEEALAKIESLKLPEREL